MRNWHIKCLTLYAYIWRKTVCNAAKQRLRVKVDSQVLLIYEADIVLFYLFAHNEEYLFAVSALTQHIDIPVIIISQQDTPGLAAKTIHSGITSYGIDELKSDRFHSIIEVGFSRYELIRSIKTDLNSTKNKLEERKLIAKAKGIVMLQKQLSEDEAYVSLRKSAMNQGVTMAELSKKIISVFQTLE